MSDYISREAAIEKMREAGCTDCCGSSDGLCGFCDFENAVRLVKSLPAADVAEARHGRWEHKKNDYSVAWCSKCKGLFDTTWHGKTAKEYFAQFAEAYRYCPRCGAKMDLEDKP